MSVRQGWPLLFLPGLLLAQSLPENAALRVGRLTSTITIDGRIDESDWFATDSIDDFRQQEPEEGAPATERTVMRVLRDDQALYVGVRAYDREPSRIRARQIRRDADLDDDDFFIFLIDSFHDRRGAFVFGTNPRALIWDAQLIGFEDPNVNWNGIWTVAAHRDSLGWTAEFRIPFRTLRFPPGQDVNFGFNAERFIRRRNEPTFWRSWKRTQGLYNLVEAGTLTSLGDLHRGRDFEMRPYLLGQAIAKERVITAGGADSVVEGSDHDVKAGVDAKFAVSPTLTADLTVNTDFAQVEADRQVINLTRFPIFFPEKREFFLESSGTFDFARPPILTPFYSRRIGLKDDEPVPIVAGARLTGRTGPWNVGLLAARTGGDDDANDAVLRVKHDLLDRSYIGAIATLRAGPGVQGTEASGGVDIDLPLVVDGRNVEPSFWITGTSTPGIPGVPLAWRAATDYPNDLFDIFMSLWRVESGFNPTLGFVRRTGIKETTGHIDFTPRPHVLGIRQLDIVLPIPSWDIIADDSGSLTRSDDWQTAELEWRPLGATFQSGDAFEINVQRFLDAPADSFEVFPGTVIPPGRYWYTRGEVNFSTSRSRPVSLDALYSWGDFYTGTNQELSMAATWRWGGHVIIDADFTRDAVRVPEGDFNALEAGGRAQYAFDPKTDLLLFAQYNNEDERVDFQLRFHWIPTIGDDVYLVWSSGYTTDPAADHQFPDHEAIQEPLSGALTLKAVHRLEF
jgi:uncharacterized protein DUF5916/cellulose/xylan binding protein with CBM9 domain